MTNQVQHFNTFSGNLQELTTKTKRAAEAAPGGSYNNDHVHGPPLALIADYDMARSGLEAGTGDPWALLLLLLLLLAAPKGWEKEPS